MSQRPRNLFLSCWAASNLFCGAAVLGFAKVCLSGSQWLVACSLWKSSWVVDLFRYGPNKPSSFLLLSKYQTSGRLTGQGWVWNISPCYQILTKPTLQTGTQELLCQIGINLQTSVPCSRVVNVKCFKSFFLFSVLCPYIRFLQTISLASWTRALDLSATSFTILAPTWESYPAYPKLWAPWLSAGNSVLWACGHLCT